MVEQVLGRMVADGQALHSFVFAATDPTDLAVQTR